MVQDFGHDAGRRNQRQQDHLRAAAGAREPFDAEASFEQARPGELSGSDCRRVLLEVVGVVGVVGSLQRQGCLLFGQRVCEERLDDARVSVGALWRLVVAGLRRQGEPGSISAAVGEAAVVTGMLLRSGC